MAQRHDDVTDSWVCRCDLDDVDPGGECRRCHKPHVSTFSQRSLDIGHQRRDERLERREARIQRQEDARARREVSRHG